MADGAIIIPNTITSKADFDRWIDNDVGDKLTTTQKNALKTDIASKLGLDMGNAITAYGRQEINKDVQFLLTHPNATSLPNIDPDPQIGDAGGANHFNELWARGNAFSDPFLIDLTAVLALMHETSEKLRAATKELRQAENQNQQDQMQAAAEDIKSQGQFQAISGAIGASMSIASGASGLAGSASAMKSVKELHTDVNSMKAEFTVPDPIKTPTPEKTALDAPGIQIGLHRLPKEGSSSTPPTTDLPPKTLDVPKSTQGSSKSSEFDKENLKAQLDDLKKSLTLPSAEAQHNNQVSNLLNQYSQTKFQEIQMVAQKWQAYGQMLDGVGKAMGSSFQGIATGFESDKAIKDKQASQSGFEKDQTSDLIKTLSDFSQQIRQTVAAIIQSQDQAANRVANV